MIDFLLQVQLSPAVVDSAAAVIQNQTNTNQELSLLDLIVKGGVLMIPLGILSVLAVYVFIERYLSIKKVGAVKENFMLMIRDNVVSGNVQAAQSLSKNTDTAIGKVISKGIQRIGKPLDVIEKSMENVANLEIYKMEKNMMILSIVAGIAPMVGFLGTIAGMVQTFYNISITSDITLGTIAGGIYVKMVTSASGLIIGIFSYACYSILNAQVDKAINRMEAASAEFIDILQEPTK